VLVSWSWCSTPGPNPMFYNTIGRDGKGHPLCAISAQAGTEHAWLPVSPRRCQTHAAWVVVGPWYRTGTTPLSIWPPNKVGLVRQVG